MWRRSLFKSWDKFVFCEYYIPKWEKIRKLNFGLLHLVFLGEVYS